LDVLDQSNATQQDAQTGLWGPCYERPFFKLEATTLALIELADLDEAPKFPIKLPAPFDSRASGFEHLQTLLISDVARPGLDGRGELGNITTVASLVHFKDYIQGYLNNKVAGIPRNEGGPGAKAEEYRAEFAAFIRAWQDPATGYWGPWYRDGGKL